jgi:predicted alpha/beta hydrolase family esterase
MKTVLLLHGAGGSDADNFWFAYIKEYLEGRGYEVWWPLIEQFNRKLPNFAKVIQFFEANMPALDQDSIIIGHSAACPIILSLLQRANTTVKQVILVGGFYKPISDGGYSDALLEPSYNWDKIRSSAKEIILLNADNDPWGCDDQQARPVALKLQAPLILMAEQGHMGSTAKNQPYREFPLLKRLII